jgi:hypothetical protein
MDQWVVVRISIEQITIKHFFIIHQLGYTSICKAMHLQNR